MGTKIWEQMSFLEKETKLLETIRQTNYEVWDGDKNEALDDLERLFKAFPEYANIVISIQQRTPMLSLRYDGEELREITMNLDTNRRICHDAAIASISGLNRICEMHELPKYADINTNDRQEVARFVGKYVAELYDVGINHREMAFYEVTNFKDKYDTERISEHLQTTDESLCDKLNLALGQLSIGDLDLDPSTIGDIDFDDGYEIEH